MSPNKPDKLIAMRFQATWAAVACVAAMMLATTVSGGAAESSTASELYTGACSQRVLPTTNSVARLIVLV